MMLKALLVRVEEKATPGSPVSLADDEGRTSW
jgi:hypothetical protein